MSGDITIRDYAKLQEAASAVTAASPKATAAVGRASQNVAATKAATGDAGGSVAAHYHAALGDLVVAAEAAAQPAAEAETALGQAGPQLQALHDGNRAIDMTGEGRVAGAG